MRHCYVGAVHLPERLVPEYFICATLSKGTPYYATFATLEQVAEHLLRGDLYAWPLPAEEGWPEHSRSLSTWEDTELARLIFENI